MSLELWSTVASIGTFVVIAATAVAAIVQLRHARSSNQIAALTELRDAFQSREFSEAMSFLETKLPQLIKNSEFRYQFENRNVRTDEFLEDINKARLIGNYFEDMGALLLSGLLDRELTCMIYSSDLTRAWESLNPLIAIARRSGGKVLWENFEFATMLAQKWIAKHPDGAYPAATLRLPMEDACLEADRAYALTRYSPSNG